MSQVVPSEQSLESENMYEGLENWTVMQSLGSAGWLSESLR
jgi:hypothetical protein